jgi:Ca2+-binding EF-hand superfamily protein
MNMKKSTMIASLGLIAVIGTGLAFAEAQRRGGAMMFQRLDANKDGKINLAELTPFVTKRFERADVNGDKTVTAAEIDDMLLKAVQKRRERMMGKVDADKNGAVTQVELDAFVGDTFKTVDADHDGNITLAEAKSFRHLWRQGNATDSDDMEK